MWCRANPRGSVLEGSQQINIPNSSSSGSQSRCLWTRWLAPGWKQVVSTEIFWLESIIYLFFARGFQRYFFPCSFLKTSFKVVTRPERTNINGPECGCNVYCSVNLQGASWALTVVTATLRRTPVIKPPLYLLERVTVELPPRPPTPPSQPTVPHTEDPEQH